MKTESFKYWYTLSEAAQVAAAKLGEPITDSDIIDRINYDELPAWCDGTGHYARHVFPACYFNPNAAHDRSYGHEMVDYIFSTSAPIFGLMGYYRIYNGTRSGMVIFKPIDETKAEALWNGGLLLLDHDGESLVQVVRRNSEVNSESRNPTDFLPYHVAVPRDKIWIAAGDLHSLLSEHANASAVPLALSLDQRARSTVESISLSDTPEMAKELRQ
jgi:hypothetical protein